MVDAVPLGEDCIKILKDASWIENKQMSVGNIKSFG